MGFTGRGRVVTDVLEIAYEQAGDPTGTPVILLHGFPYDVRAFDEIAPPLAAAGCRVLAPYLRGFGGTRFRDPATPRSGQQAALARDLLDFMDALGIARAIVGGYDWGGRAACLVAALFPERVIGLVTVDGYNVQDIARSGEPADPATEQTFWYQYYFHSERGRRGLERNREALCALLWRSWSPTWAGADAAFPASAPSLHNPDFVAVVIHSYRHRYALVAGDPRYEALEGRIAAQPPIVVPTVALEGADDGVGGPIAGEDRAHFTGAYRYELVPGVGHNLPQEAPDAVVRAVLALLPG